MPGAGGGLPSSCDDDWILPADAVVALVPFELAVRDTTDHEWVNLDVQGEQGMPTAVGPVVTQQPPYHVWTFTISGHLAGSLIALFVENAEPPYPGDPVSACEIIVQAPGR